MRPNQAKKQIKHEPVTCHIITEETDFDQRIHSQRKMNSFELLIVTLNGMNHSVVGVNQYVLCFSFASTACCVKVCGRGSLLTCGDVENNPGPSQSHIRNLQDLLIDCPNMDTIQLKFHLNRFGLTEAQGETLEQMRLQLQKVVLEEILKTTVENRAYFERYLSEISGKIRKRNTGYDCCFSGCRFQASRHKSFIRHLKQTHPRTTDIKCNYKKKCIRILANIEDLVLHVKEEHSSLVNTVQHRGALIPVNFPCMCNLHSCGSQHFRNIQSLMTHVNTFHHADTRSCIFDDCNKQFPPSYNSRNHFRQKHINTKKMKLKAIHTLNAQILAEFPEAFSDVDDENGIVDSYDSFDIDWLETNEEPDEECEKYFLDYYADFLNRLVHDKFIPQSTVQEISDEYYENTKKAGEFRENRLRASLEEITDRNQATIDEIVRNVIKDDFFQNAQEKLNTQYKRTKYVKENMKYVEPLEIVLNKSEVERGERKDVIHYVPIIETLKNLMEDKTVIKMLNLNGVNEVVKDGAIADITDGSVFKSNRFFQENEGAMGLLLYSDGVELKVFHPF